MIDYRYAIVRVVPRAERDESVNVGIIVYSPAMRSLAVEVTNDLAVVQALDPDVDLDALRDSLTALERICAGEPAGGPAAGKSAAFRFGHLTAPRSTMLRTSGTHGGVAEDLASAAQSLYLRFVAR